MRCVICRNGGTRRGEVTVTLERGDVTLVMKGVPADVCDNCGEEYLDEETTTRLLTEAERAVEEGVRVEVRKYRAA